MIKFFGHQPPGVYDAFRVGGTCPHCKQATRFNPNTKPDESIMRRDGILAFTASYSCDFCLGPIPVEWTIQGYNGNNLMVVSSARLIRPVKEPFDVEHVPEEVRKEIDEALDCLSVSAYSGFAALCRRIIQAVCTNIGAGATDKVKRQVDEMIELTGLGSEWKDLAIQIMLSGHNGAHPHLPDMNLDRSKVLLSLMQDLIYEIYTRPGKIREAAALRQKAIQQSAQ